MLKTPCAKCAAAALLEADVALPVVQGFISRVKGAVGHEVNKKLTPGQEFVKIVPQRAGGGDGRKTRPSTGGAENAPAGEC